MRIAFYFNNRKIDSSTFRICQQTFMKFVDMGWEVDLFCSSEIEIEGLHLPLNIKKCYKWNLLDATGGWSLKDAFYRSKNVLIHKYDLIFGYECHRPANLIPIIIAKFFTKSIIINEWWEWYGYGGISSERRKNIRNFIIGGYDSITEVFANELCNGNICITSTLQQRAKLKRSIILHGGVDSKNLFPIDINESRTKLGIGKNKKIIGLINACLEDHKDNSVFIEAFIELVNKYNDLILFITGERKYVQKYVSPFISKENLLYFEWLEYNEYNYYLNACDFCVLPFSNTLRNRGRWPNKIGDFIATQKFILTNPTGDVMRIVIDHNLGLLCEDNPKSYYLIISNIIEGFQSFPEWNSRAAELLSVKTRVEKIYDFCNELLLT